MTPAFIIRKFYNLKIRHKNMLAVFMLIISLVTVLVSLQISSHKKALEKALAQQITAGQQHLEKRSLLIISKLTQDLENFIATYDLGLVALQIDKAVVDQEVLYAILRNKDGNVVYQAGPQQFIAERSFLFKDQKNSAPNQQRQLKLARNIILEQSAEISVSTTAWGQIYLGFSLEKLYKQNSQAQQEIQVEITRMIQRSLLVALVFMIISGTIAYLISIAITKPLENLNIIAHEIGHGNYNATNKIKKRGNDEIASLSQAFIYMGQQLSLSHAQIAEHNRSLEQQVNERTIELKAAYLDLKASQEQLIEAEKMVALGSLVVGVAHEINTPIGVGITAVTHLKHATQIIKQKFQDRTINKPIMENYLEEVNEGVLLTLTNLQRTSELVANFKQVSVDQASHEQRKFNLREYIDSILVSLRPKLKMAPVEIKFNCSANIILDSYPGALAQIITNFIINSLVHGFEKGVTGKIEISTQLQKEVVTIFYHDDGRGIDSANIDKIFDPFFTTKLGEGGSGLGLHIVYNIVNQTMGGSIFCESEPGQGTTFIVTLPLTVKT